MKSKPDSPAAEDEVNEKNAGAVKVERNAGW